MAAHTEQDTAPGESLGPLRADSRAVPGYPIGDGWWETLERLRAYVAAHGHLPAGRQTAEAFRLGQWAVRQCISEAAGRLHPEARAALEAIESWVWGVTDWDRRANLVERYAAKHGELPVGDTRMFGREIGGWAVRQRRRHIAGALSAEQVARLEAIPGWSWEPTRANVDLHHGRAAALRAATAVTGTVLIDDTWLCPDNPGRTLWAWTQTLRADHRPPRRHAVSTETARFLEALPDWTWDGTAAHEARAWRILAARCAALPGGAAEAALGGPGSSRLHDAYAAAAAGTLERHVADELAAVAGWDALEVHARTVAAAWQLRLRLAELVREHCAGRELEVLDDAITNREPVTASELARRWGIARQSAMVVVQRVRSKMLHPRVLSRLSDSPDDQVLTLATASVFDWRIPAPAKLT